MMYIQYVFKINTMPIFYIKKLITVYVCIYMYIYSPKNIIILYFFKNKVILFVTVPPHSMRDILPANNVKGHWSKKGAK